MLFRRLVLSALLVGVVSGLLLSAVQRWQVIPIIDAAERYERARAPQPDAAAAGHTDHVHAAAGHEHAPGAWEPAEGVERIGFTVLSNVLSAVGFALVMLAAMAAVLRRRGVGRRATFRLDWRYGLLWGLAGYAIFFVAPSLGHPPEIPGTVSAPLEARQLWWTFAATFTAAGLAIAAFVKSPWRWAGFALLAVPHLVGAPQSGMSPFVGFPVDAAAQMGDLARRFVWATAIANAVFWIALGALSGWAAQRFVKQAVA